MEAPAPADKRFPNLRVFDHPLIQHKLLQIRNAETGHRSFRALVAQVAALMVFEITRHFPTSPATVRTPVSDANGLTLRSEVTLVPILRAGLVMAEGVLHLMPEARVGHLGMKRDEDTLEPVVYLSKLPKTINAGPVVLIDPMLATGGSASRALTIIREEGARDLRFLSLVAAPEGVQKLLDDHPDVTVYAAALDERLNDKGFIVPGLGDAGDRLFGTV
ncbi:MAG: uracil phosphoribosyltransferase [Phycisphaerales bacterium]